jgi:hypothetical protein
MPVTTLLDIAIQNGSDAVVGLIEDVRRAHPEISNGAARTIVGTSFKTLARTSLPTVGFRQANAGSTPQKSTWENRVFSCHVLNPRWEIDVAVADAHEDGAAVAIANEAAGQMESAMVTLGAQFYYGAGTGGDANGPPGLIQLHDTAQVVDAGGTTDSTASSLWAVRWGGQGVTWLWGQNGELALSEIAKQRVTDAAGGVYSAYCQEILARPGLMVGEKYAVGRIKKLTADSGKGLTDALISELLSKFPAGRGPDALYCSRRSLFQLQKSRTATNATGAPAPIPNESFGVPLFVTDSILDTETLAL